MTGVCNHKNLLFFILCDNANTNTNTTNNNDNNIKASH